MFAILFVGILDFYLFSSYYSRSMRSPSNEELTIAEIKAFKNSVETLKFNSFDAYFNMVEGIRVTCLNKDDFLESTCTCSWYFKEYCCKHIIGVAVLEKVAKIPNEAKTKPLGEKPKRGRPAKATKALEWQPKPIGATVLTNAPPKAKRGRPPKARQESHEQDDSEEDHDEPVEPPVRNLTRARREKRKHTEDVASNVPAKRNNLLRV